MPWMKAKCYMLVAVMVDFLFGSEVAVREPKKKKYERTEKKKYEIISNYFGAKLNVTNGNICYIAELNPEEQSLNKPDYNLSLISCVHFWSY